jgi:Motility quorum-sensing regulator, toxin of MqsA
MNVEEINNQTYNLDMIKTAFKTKNNLNMTVSAMQGMYDLGLCYQDVVDVIQSLTIFDFYKSMQPSIL